MKVIEYNETVSILTEAMRECDVEFETTGGGTRHYVRDLLLPYLAQRDICLAKMGKQDYQIVGLTPPKQEIK